MQSRGRGGGGHAFVRNRHAVERLGARTSARGQEGECMRLRGRRACGREGEARVYGREGEGE